MKFKFSDFKIIIDKQEKRPWSFDNSIVKHLKTGDYSLEGYESSIVVERKSTDDFVGSISSGRKRFMAELDRAKSIKHFCVIVEGSWFDLMVGNYRSKMLPSSAVGTAVSIMTKYSIPVIMAETRKQAEHICRKFLRLSLMREYEEQKEE